MKLETIQYIILWPPQAPSNLSTIPLGVHRPRLRNYSITYSLVYCNLRHLFPFKIKNFFVNKSVQISIYFICKTIDDHLHFMADTYLNPYNFFYNPDASRWFGNAVKAHPIVFPALLIEDWVLAILKCSNMSFSICNSLFCPS